MGVGAGLYMCDVVKKVHVRYLISWWVLVSDCRCMPQLRRYSPTNACDGDQMANFWRFFASCIQRASCSTFQTWILNSY